MKKLIAIILLLPLFFCTCYADELITEALDISGIDALGDMLPEEIEKISGKIDDNGLYDSTGALKRLWENMLLKFKAEIGDSINSFTSLILISLLCSISCTFCHDKNMCFYINIAGVCAIAAMFVGSFDGMVSETVRALNDIDLYSKAALPAVFTAAAAGGSLVGSPARYAAVSLGLNVIMNTARNIIVPLIYCFLSLSLCKGLSNNAMLMSLQHFVKWLCTILLAALTIVFSAYINITGAITVSADALAVKTARLVISNSLPVVGGMISDAASTVLSAAGMIKSSAGALSLVAVCALCVGPFVSLSVKLFIFKIASSACDMVPGSRISGFINDIGTALSLLLGLLGSVSIILFISFMSAIKVVTA